MKLHLSRFSRTGRHIAAARAGLRRTLAVGTGVSIIIFAGYLSCPQTDAVGNDCAPNPLTPEAEMFATSNTDEIDNLSDARLNDRLETFESQVNGIIFSNAAVPVGSDLVHGIFWSNDRHDATYEPSREFHIACTDRQDATQIAKQVARQFKQESVLVFMDSPTNDLSASSFIARVPGIDVQRFRDALAADPMAARQLGGGSITDDGVLVLVAFAKDTALADRVLKRAGGKLDISAVQRGYSDFVSAN